MNTKNFFKREGKELLSENTKYGGHIDFAYSSQEAGDSNCNGFRLCFIPFINLIQKKLWFILNAWATKRLL